MPRRQAATAAMAVTTSPAKKQKQQHQQQPAQQQQPPLAGSNGSNPATASCDPPAVGTHVLVPVPSCNGSGAEPWDGVVYVSTLHSLSVCVFVCVLNLVIHIVSLWCVTGGSPSN